MFVQLKKEAEKQEAELKTQIQSYMTTASVLEGQNGVTLATWKNDPPGERFDEKRFAVEQPELYKQYLINRTGARKFLVKQPKKIRKVLYVPK